MGYEMNVTQSSKVIYNFSGLITRRHIIFIANLDLLGMMYSLIKY